MRRSLAVLVVVFTLAPSVQAASVRHVWRTAPRLVGLPGLASERYQNAADIILEQAVRNLPLHPAAASAYTYRWNAERNAIERVDDSVSPWFLTERGQTMGAGLLNVGVTFGYYRVECSSGCEIGNDPFPIRVSEAAIRYTAVPDLLYTVGTFNFTYGVTDDIDVNVAIPIATLDADLRVTRQDTPGGPIRAASRTLESANIADMMVRAKYRFFETSGPLGSAAGAGGLRVRIPTGNPTRGLGTGYGEIGPYLALSTSLLDGWLDSHWDAGVDAGIGNTRWSSAHYSWALDVHAPRGDEWWTRLALAWSILGRSEFNGLRARSSYSGNHVSPNGFVVSPYLCADADRHDYVDTTLGLRVNVASTFVLSLGVFKAINDQGVRPSEWAPVASIEGTF
jgi:hypothetical protein